MILQRGKTPKFKIEGMVKMAMVEIRGDVPGRMLAGAMIRAHAMTPRKLKGKQPAGVGKFVQYLDVNSVRMEEWKRQTKLPPEAVLARASLSSEWLAKAGKLLETTTDTEKRKALLWQIIAPHLMQLNLLGVPVGGGKVFKLEASQLEAELELHLPGIELEVVGISGGKFKVGGGTGFDDKRPVREITFTGFWIGKYPVTNAQYGIYMEQTGHEEPTFWNNSRFGKNYPNNPVVGVNYYDSEAFARWLDMRLLTEAEWEYAARGTDGRNYPWGNVLNSSKATFSADGTRRVNAHPEGASPFGVMDMAGNVWEWVTDWYNGSNYDPNDLVNPKGPVNGSYRVLCGGSWHGDCPARLRVANRDSNLPGFCSKEIGFRIAEGFRDN